MQAQSAPGKPVLLGVQRLVTRTVLQNRTLCLCFLLGDAVIRSEGSPLLPDAE